VADGFQLSAYQNNAFQHLGAPAPAFQTSAFQQTGFQTTYYIGLTGVASTFAVGSVLVDSRVALSSAEILASQGIMSSTLDAPITGASISTTQGNVVEGDSYLLVGQSIQGDVGSVSVDVSVILTGITIQTAAGSIAAPSTFVVPPSLGGGAGVYLGTGSTSKIELNKKAQQALREQALYEDMLLFGAIKHILQNSKYDF
jgi:hypothetical protein